MSLGTIPLASRASPIPFRSTDHFQCLHEFLCSSNINVINSWHNLIHEAMGKCIMLLHDRKVYTEALNAVL